MTLRFFRRKPTAQDPPEQLAPEDRLPASPEASASGRTTGSQRGGSRSTSSSSANAEPSTSERSTRSRRGGSRSASRSKSPAKTAAEETKPAAAAKPASSRTRRGRRGGAARKTAAAPAEAPAASPEPAPIIPLRDEPAMPEAAVLEQLSERQLTALKGLQGSLSAIENRLAGIDRLAPASVERPRVGIFVDVPNVVYAADRLRIAIDFGKLLEFLTRDRELVRASAYAPISDDPTARLESQRFVEPFVGFGYRIVTKPLKRYADGSTKANFDVELAIDVLTMSDRLDIVTLVSGDGDFRRLAELVASKGVRVTVVAFGESTAAELRAVADEYIDLNDHLAELRVK